MKVLPSKKYLYLLGLFVVALMGLVIIPTYAKFSKEYTTSSDVAELVLDFNIGITNIEEYEVIKVPAGKIDTFNVKVINSSDSTLYYGVWYKMVEPTTKTSDMIIAKVAGTNPTTSGELASNVSTSPSIVIMNNSDTDITLKIGVSSSTTSTIDIEYLGGKKLINKVYSINYMKNSTVNDIRSDTYKTYIKNASFVNYINTTNAALDGEGTAITWDMSTDQDNGIIAWLETNDTTDESNNTYYDLYIGSNEKIYAQFLNAFFNNMINLESISFDNLDTSLTKNMNNMFSYCQSIVSLDLRRFDTSNVSDMSNMFAACWEIENIDVSSFNTSKVTNMYAMFYWCKSMENLDLSNFDTSNVTDMGLMFGDSNYVSLNLTSFDTSNVTNMGYMFGGCSRLISLDVSSFDTSSVTNMGSMFRGCPGLTSLDLSNFDTGNVTIMDNIFNGCQKLITTMVIRNNSTTYVDMFNGAATAEGSNIKVYYIEDNQETDEVNESTEELVRAMVATGSTNVKVGNDEDATEQVEA